MEWRPAAIAVVLLAACQGSERPPSAGPPVAPAAAASAPPPAGASSAAPRPSVEGETGKAPAPRRGSLRDAGAVADAGRLTQGDAGTGPVLSAQRTIAALRPDFRACYNAGLKADPAKVGSVFETVTINADGSVASAVSSQVDGLGAEVVACFERVLTTAHFPPPGMDGSTLKLPIEFRRGSATVSNVGDLPPYVEPAAGRAPKP